MKNDKRRITAKERADVVIETYAGIFANFDTFWFRRFLIKEFGRHVKAAHKRHARKNVCFRPEDKIDPVEAFNRLVELSNRRKTS